MSAKRVLLAVPYRARDLEGHALVGYFLNRRYGHEVLYTNSYGLESKLLNLAPDALVLDHLSWNFKVEQSKLCKRLGIKVVILPTEGLFQDEEGAVRRAGKLHDATHLPDLYLTWGDYPRRALLNQKLMTERQVRTVGCPRFDFYAEPYAAMTKTKNELVASLGFKDARAPLILWATNTPHASRSRAKMLARQTKKAKKPVAEVQAHIEDHQTQLREHTRIVAELARKNPGCNFIIKVHPAEWINPYLKLAKEISNIRVAYDAPIKEFLFHADVLLQRNCTTATEAWMLEKPVLNLEIGEYRRPVRDQYAVCNHRVYNSDEACTVMQKYLGGMTIPPEQQLARDKFIEDFYFKIDGKSGERCAAAINEILTVPEYTLEQQSEKDRLTAAAKTARKKSEDGRLVNKIKDFIGVERTMSVRFWKKMLRTEAVANAGLFTAEPEITEEMVREIYRRFDSIAARAQVSSRV